MGNDVERVVIGCQWPQIQSGNILNTVFLFDTVGQCFVASYIVAQLFNVAYKIGMGLTKLLFAFFIACIEQGPIGQNDTGRAQHAVGVGMYSAVHSRTIVAYNASYHGTVYRCRVGRKHTAEWF